MWLKIGGDYDYQFRYKHNVSSVVLKEDTNNLLRLFEDMVRMV